MCRLKVGLFFPVFAPLNNRHPRARRKSVKSQPIRKAELDRHLYTCLPTVNGDVLVRYQAAVKLTPREYEGVEHFVKAGYFLNVSDFVRSAVRDKLGALKPTLVRKVSARAAQREVYQHIKSHPDVYPDEIASALNLDIETVMDAVAALLSKGKIGEFA